MPARESPDAMSPAANPAARRLLASVLRFCANTCRRKRKNPVSSTSSSAMRGANRQQLLAGSGGCSAKIKMQHVLRDDRHLFGDQRGTQIGSQMRVQLNGQHM